MICNQFMSFAPKKCLFWQTLSIFLHINIGGEVNDKIIQEEINKKKSAEAIRKTRYKSRIHF